MKNDLISHHAFFPVLYLSIPDELSGCVSYLSSTGLWEGMELINFIINSSVINQVSKRVIYFVRQEFFMYE